MRTEDGALVSVSTWQQQQWGPIPGALPKSTTACQINMGLHSHLELVRQVTQDITQGLT